MSSALQPAVPRRQSLERLLSRVDLHDERWDLDALVETPIDRSKWFVCPTLTPLYYTRSYSELKPTQQLRYNQLTAMGFNELIAFFESSFASSVIRALRSIQDASDSADWESCLQRFLDDERRHVQWWRELNRLSEPEFYADGDARLIRPAFALRMLLRLLTSHPKTFPAVYWIMLALEERSLDISRRCLKMDRDQIEPRYRAIYRQHLIDESSHVQIDWHLIEAYYRTRSTVGRRFDARFLRMMLSRFFLTPNRAAVRVIHQLVDERPELKRQAPAMIGQLKALGGCSSYHAMMYSRRTTPILFALFDERCEFHSMSRALKAYEPIRTRGA